MKIAEAMLKISELDSQIQLTESADIFIYTDKDRSNVIHFKHGVAKVMNLVQELDNLKHALAVANVTTKVSFGEYTVTLGGLRLVITALRKRINLFNNAYTQARRNPEKVVREYAFDANGNQITQNYKEQLNGFTVAELEAELSIMRSQLKEAEGLLQRTNWSVDIPEAPVVQ